MLKLLNASDYSKRRPQGKPTLTLSGHGRIYINDSAITLLGANHHDRLLICQDEDSYYIGISPYRDDEAGLVLRAKQSEKSLHTSCAALVSEIIKVMDLAIAPGKKKSVRLDIHTDPIEHNGIKYYKID